MKYTIKKTVVIVVLILVLLLILFRLFVFFVIELPFRDPYSPAGHQEFKTQYTEQEHIERISEITREKTKGVWLEEEGAYVVNFSVEIVYSFYDSDPEYFLITLELDREIVDQNAVSYIGWSKASSKYMHLCGFIIDDKYYRNCLFGFLNGRSLYDVTGYGDCKKFYGNNAFGVETENGDILLLKDDVECKIGETATNSFPNVPDSMEYNYYYHITCKNEATDFYGEITEDVCFKQRVLTLEEQKALMGWGCLDVNMVEYKISD